MTRDLAQNSTIANISILRKYPCHTILQKLRLSDCDGIANSHEVIKLYLNCTDDDGNIVDTHYNAVCYNAILHMA